MNYKKIKRGKRKDKYLKKYFDIDKLLSQNNILEKDAVTDLIGLINGFKNIPKIPKKYNQGREMKITLMRKL
jgi:hypothetical protein